MGQGGRTTRWDQETVPGDNVQEMGPGEEVQETGQGDMTRGRVQETGSRELEDLEELRSDSGCIRHIRRKKLAVGCRLAC